ncbi:alpha/beta hydrolase [Alcaligenaceae bacterium B3P038]|nr:alpha/beta hydrolase [Alcaligenaceae bacterium B3P038]
MLDKFLKQAMFAVALLFASQVSAAPALPPEEFPTPPGFTPAYQTVDGVKLHYLKGGQGPMVLLVHGFAQTWYEWHQIMPLLAKTHTVVAIDLPGLGQSEAPKSYAGQDVAKLIHTFAKSHSPNAPFDLVSHDIGNWNTFPMVAEHPKDFKHVVFMEAPLPDEGIYTFPAFTPQGESPMWHFSFFAAGGHFAEKMVAGREEMFFDHFIKSHAVNKAVFTPELIGLYARSYAKPQSFNAAMEYYRALPETQVRNIPLFKNKLTMKTMAIGGGSPVSVGQFQVDQLAKYTTNMKGVVIPNCGHWVPEECTETFNATIVDFLDGK